jgi:zinc protease
MRMLSATVLAIAAGLSLYADSDRPATMTRADILPFSATEATLPNGLRVIVVPTPFRGLASVRVVVRSGTRNEIEPGRSGFAHFFEHLMYRGTPTHSPQRYQQIMATAGARENAVTRDDSTTFYATFAKDDLRSVLTLYADMFANLSFSEDDFKTEAGAILGEYEKNSADSFQRLYEAFRRHRYAQHPYRHTTLGSLEDIRRFPNAFEYARQFFARWYQPQHTTLVVAGDVEPRDVLALARSVWGGWRPRITTAEPVVPKEPLPTAPRFAQVTDPSASLPWLAVSFPAPRFDDRTPDAAAVEVFSAGWLGDGSPLFRKLVIEEKKVDQLRVDNPSRIDDTHVAVFARLTDPAAALYVRDEIVATFRAAAESPLDVGRLEAAKTFTKYQLARSIDSTDRVAAVVGDFAPFARTFETLNRYYRTLESVTVREINDAARRYFTDAGLAVVAFSKEPLAAEVMQPLLRRAPAVVSGLADRVATPFIVQRSPLPMLNVKLLFDVGSVNDPRGKEGLASLTAAMIAGGGSRTLPIDRIDSVFYPKAASFASRTDKEMTTFTVVVHRDQWKPVLDIALSQLLEPGWRPEDFARLKAKQRNALVQDLRADNDEELAKERLQANIFRGTGYGHASVGTVAGIDAITLEDVTAFARRMYVQGRLTVGVAGDVPEETVQTLKDAVRRLPAGTTVEPRPVVTPAEQRGLKVEIIEKAGRSTAISAGFAIDVTRSHPDFAALSVARSWLGEHRMPFARLYQRIREMRGLNYGAYAYIEAFPGGMFTLVPDANVARRRQLFELWLRPTAPENAPMMLRIAFHELNRLIVGGMSPGDFETTRAFLLKNVFVATARQEQRLGYELDSRWYGIGEFTTAMRSALGRLTVEQVNDAVKRHLSTGAMSVVMVTPDAAALKAALVRGGPSTLRYETDKPALLSEDAAIAAVPLHLSDADVTITPVEQVFAQ